MSTTTEPSLSDVLASRGLTHERVAHGRRTVRDAAGAVLIAGTAEQVWQWLAATPAPEATR